jgi:hypothetical protein
MRAFGVILVGFSVFALSIVLLDDCTFAQDTKDEKKTEEKKTDDKKPDEKKKVRLTDPSDVIRAKKKVGKIKDVKTEDPAEVTVVLVDSAKYTDFLKWDKEHKTEICTTKDAGAKKDKAKKYQTARPTEYDKIYSGDELLIPVTETVRIRTNFLPKAFDENNKEKKLTTPEITKLKAPPLPGYTSALANLKIGQIVEVYIKPPPPTPKNAPPMPMQKAKGPIGADPKDPAPLPRLKPKRT